MSIKKNSQIKDELIQIKEWVRAKDEQWAYDNQEFIIALIRLLMNQKFRSKIRFLRKKYRIPQGWYTEGKLQDRNMDDEKLRWRSNRPSMPSDMDMFEIGTECNIDVNRYGAFIENYLFLGKVIPMTPYNYALQNEFRYKASVELDFGEKDEDFGINPKKKIYLKKASIVFYKDTTLNQLIEFIKRNKKEINLIQKDLPSHPHPQKYGYFKREILIYLLYLLGEKPADIVGIIGTAFKSEISRQYVNQVVRDIEEIAKKSFRK